MKTLNIGFFLAVGTMACGSICAETLENLDGVKIGEHLTIRPYVSVQATYDSNVLPHYKAGEDILWTISPGFKASYVAEKWALLLDAYYNYRQYCKNENSDLNRHSFGEKLRWNWSSSLGNEKGWSLLIGEAFQQISMADSMDDRGYSRDGTCDYRNLEIMAALQRRFSEKWHGNVNASYYWLDYLNDNSRAYYGWDRWAVGLEGGYAASKWTDILIAGSYQGYTQDNSEGYRYASNGSQGWAVQAGIGSYMTDRISYRLLAGWSRFDYGNGTDPENGFVYTASGNWKIGETWNTMLLATSYYRPSEREYAAKSRVDAISWGLAKTMVRGKLRATLDLRYHRETNESVSRYGSGYDYIVDIITARLGLDYRFNRIFSAFGNVEYQKSWDDNERTDYYDYDRFRLTLGVRLSY